jgi:hypothetical protein
METWGGVTDSVVPDFGNSWGLVSRPGRFIPPKSAPGIYWTGGWVGPSTGLDDVEKRKPFPYWDSNSESSAV